MREDCVGVESTAPRNGTMREDCDDGAMREDCVGVESSGAHADCVKAHADRVEAKLERGKPVQAESVPTSEQNMRTTAAPGICTGVLASPRTVGTGSGAGSVVPSVTAPVTKTVSWASIVACGNAASARQQRAGAWTNEVYAGTRRASGGRRCGCEWSGAERRATRPGQGVTSGGGGPMRFRRWRRRKDCATCGWAQCGKAIDDVPWRAACVC
jgi:hypothetical protein